MPSEVLWCDLSIGCSASSQQQDLDVAAQHVKVHDWLMHRVNQSWTHDWLTLDRLDVLNDAIRRWNSTPVWGRLIVLILYFMISFPFASRQ